MDMLYSLGGAKSWELPTEPGPRAISVLNEWCQSGAPPLILKWHFALADSAAPAKADSLHKSNKVDQTVAYGKFRYWQGSQIMPYRILEKSREHEKTDAF